MLSIVLLKPLKILSYYIKMSPLSLFNIEIYGHLNLYLMLSNYYNSKIERLFTLFRTKIEVDTQLDIHLLKRRRKTGNYSCIALYMVTEQLTS